MKKHIVVIGGGIAGTAAAYELMKCGYDVTIIEKEKQLGGRIRSVLVHGAAVEMGAGFMTRAYSNMHAFLRSSGLDGKLYRQHAKSGIVRSGKTKMATLSTLVGTDALSWQAKLRPVPLLIKILSHWSQIDIHAPWLLDKYDNRSVADMFHSTRDTEFLEYVLEPILDGYFYWTPEHTSEAMLLIIGKALMLSGTSKLKGGLRQIPERAAMGAKQMLGCEVQLVQQKPDGTFSIAIKRNDKQQVLQASGVVCATPASAVSTMMPDLTQQQRQFFDAVTYSSGITLARTYLQEQTRGDQGIAFPRQEGTQLSAVTVSPELGDGQAVYGTVKTYASGATGKKLCALTDDEIIKTLSREMEPVRLAVLVDRAELVAIHLQRWPEALPIIDVGHFHRLRSFANGEIESPGQALVFAGDYIGGPFMEGAYTSGIQAAVRLEHVMSVR